MDNSDEDDLTFYMCRNGSLTRKFTITDRNDNGTAGTFKIVDSQQGGYISIDGNFDNGFTDADRSRIGIKFVQSDSFDEDQFGAGHDIPSHEGIDEGAVNDTLNGLESQQAQLVPTVSKRTQAYINGKQNQY